MALVVEDGTGLPNAESYISVSDADTYISSIYLSTDAQIETWNALETADKEVALRRCTRDIDAIFAQSYLSHTLTTTQALKFPRQPFYEYGASTGNATPNWDGMYYITPTTSKLVTGIPAPLANAVAELALILLNGYDATGASDRTGAEIYKEIQVGAIMTRTEWAYPSSIGAQKIAKVSNLMQPYLRTSPFGANFGINRG